MKIIQTIRSWRLSIKISVPIVLSLALYGTCSLVNITIQNININSDTTYKIEIMNINRVENQYVFSGSAQDTVTGQIVEFNYASPDIVKADPRLVKAIIERLAARDRDTYRPLNPDLKEEIITSLKSIFSKYREIKFNIIVSVEKGSKSRELIADELVELFLNSGFTAKKQLTSVMAEKIPPLAIYLSPEAIEFAKEITSSLKPFLNTRFKGKPSEHRAKEDIGIGVYGEPQFLPNGAVVFK